MNLIISLHPIAFEYSYDCVAREMLLVIVKIWLRWRLFAKFYEILFKQYFCLYSAAADHPPPLFFAGSKHCTVRVWDVSSMQQVAELKGHTSYVTSVAFDSSGKYLASGEVA